MKKQFLLLFGLISILGIAYATGFPDLNAVSNSLYCSNSCDNDEILKALGKNNANGGKAAQKACIIACKDQCFSTCVNNKSSIEKCAFKCKDSLKKSWDNF